MKKPLIHPTSELTLSLMMKDFPQSLLISGPVGVGLGTISEYIAKSIGDVSFTMLPEKDEKTDIEKGVISVDSIRRLYDRTRSIQAGKLVIIIDYAERMGTKAQNAFLKLLEEPGNGVHFIVATHTPSKLLSTMTSRGQFFEIRPLTIEQSNAYLDSLKVTNEQKRTQLLFMASGLPAEIFRLTTDEKYFDYRVSIVRDARDLLQATIYKKLIIAHQYKDDREGALTLLTDASSLLRRSITQKPQTNLIAQIDSLLYTHQQIQANGNIRLCLARLVL